MIFLASWQNAFLNQSWASISGNYQVFEYYTGVEAGNPSGTTANVKTIKNYDSAGNLVFAQTFEYNLVDNVVKITGA